MSGKKGRSGRRPKTSSILTEAAEKREADTVRVLKEYVKIARDEQQPIRVRKKALQSIAKMIILLPVAPTRRQDRVFITTAEDVELGAELLDAAAIRQRKLLQEGRNYNLGG